MEALSQPLGISKHPHLKGVDGTFMFSYRALLTYWKGNYSPGQIICTFKNVKYSLPKISTEKLSKVYFPLNRLLYKIPLVAHVSLNYKMGS